MVDQFGIGAGLLIASVPAVVGLYLFFVRKSYGSALTLLVLSSFLLRLLLASADPFLHLWDERYHALVAKHLMDFPLKPMMRLDPVLPFDRELWCCGHVWVHKQPLFLWQMALSMKVFGVNELALRLPSVVMGTISTYLIFDTAKRWTKETTVAFIAAFLFTFSAYNMELISGRFSLDHNDLAFGFYVTASIWAFVSYLDSKSPIRWAVAVGLFVGCAILNKWLTGLLVFGGWGLYTILDPASRGDLRKWRDLAVAMVVACLVFLPWQLYILWEFPVESGIMFAHNRRHIFEVLENRGGSVWYYLNFLQEIYRDLFIPFLVIGIPLLLKRKGVRTLTISLLAMVLVIYLFFSLVVQTKMTAFTYPVHAIVWIVIAYGLYVSCSSLSSRSKFERTHIFVAALLLGSLYNLDLPLLIGDRSPANQKRNDRIHNTEIYRKLDATSLEGRIIINVKSLADTELMFYQDLNAYHWYPTEQQMDSLSNLGYKFAAFVGNNGQHLPAYIANNKDILILRDVQR